MSAFASSWIKPLSSFHPRRRVFSGNGVRKSKGLLTHIPDSVHTGLRAVALFETMDSVEEVSSWLRMVGLPQYVKSFASHGVTCKDLLGLSAADLRDTLGVKKLRHRRIILDGILYLDEALQAETRVVLPEDGRILTHLSNERLVLGWLRFVVVVETVALAMAKFTEPLGTKTDANKAVIATAALLSVIGILATFYGGYRYCRMQDMIDTPGEDFYPDRLPLLLPCMFGLVLAFASTYMYMSNQIDGFTQAAEELVTEAGKEIALLAMLMI